MQKSNQAPSYNVYILRNPSSCLCLSTTISTVGPAPGQHERLAKLLDFQRKLRFQTQLERARSLATHESALGNFRILTFTRYHTNSRAANHTICVFGMELRIGPLYVFLFVLYYARIDDRVPCLITDACVPGAFAYLRARVICFRLFWSFRYSVIARAVASLGTLCRKPIRIQLTNYPA